MIGKFLRPYTKRFVEGNLIYKLLGKVGISPNMFSLIAIVWAGGAAYFIYRGELLISLPFLVLAMIWDGIDGAYARTVNRVTLFGAYLEGMIDLYVEVIVVLGIIVWKYPFEGALFMTLSLLLSYTKPRVALVIPAGNEDWPSIGEKVERRFILVLAIGIYAFYPTFIVGGYVFDVLSVALYLLSLFVFIGGIQRMLYAKKMINEYEKKQGS